MTANKRQPFLREPWSTMTLPGLAQGAAVLRPDRASIADMEETQALADRPARNLTAAMLQSEALLLARKLRALGLNPGERVLVRLPNTSEAAITILAIILAGGVPAVVPVFAPVEKAAAAAGLCGAVGIVSMARFAGLPLAAQAQSIAAQCSAIRFTAAFGARMPEGVTSLDAWQNVEFIGAKQTTKIRATDDALVSFDEHEGTLRAFARTHEHLIAGASTAAGAMHVAADSRLLVTIPAASAAGVLYGLVMPLLTGAAVELMPLFDSCSFAQSLGEGRGLTVLLPAACENAYRTHCAERRTRSETLVLLHRIARDLPVLEKQDDAERTIDALWLGEALGWTCRRGADVDPRQARHAVTDMVANDRQPVEYLIDSKGRLAISGPLMPRQANSISDSVPTSLLVGAAIPSKGAAKSA